MKKKLWQIRTGQQARGRRDEHRFTWRDLFAQRDVAIIPPAWEPARPGKRAVVHQPVLNVKRRWIGSPITRISSIDPRRCRCGRRGLRYIVMGVCRRHLEASPNPADCCRSTASSSWFFKCTRAPDFAYRPASTTATSDRPTSCSPADKTGDIQIFRFRRRGLLVRLSTDPAPRSPASGRSVPHVTGRSRIEHPITAPTFSRLASLYQLLTGACRSPLPTCGMVYPDHPWDPPPPLTFPPSRRCSTTIVAAPAMIRRSWDARLIRPAGVLP